MHNNNIWRLESKYQSLNYFSFSFAKLLEIHFLLT